MSEIDVETAPESPTAKPVPKMASAMDAYRERMGKLLNLTEAQRSRVLTFLKNNIDGWTQDTSILHQRLRDDNDLVEGVVEDTGEPWSGASIVHVPVTEMYMEVYHSILRRSILGAGIIWLTTAEDEHLMEFTDDVSDMMNDKAFNEWNVEEALEGVMWTACRDGLGAIQVSWLEEYEPATDILLIESPDEFMAEFPTAEAAGLVQSEYDELAGQAQSATPEQPLEVPVKFERLTYYGNKCEIVELVDLVMLPATSPDIGHESCRGYGKRYEERKAITEKKGKGKNPLYYPSAVKKLLTSEKSTTQTELAAAQDMVEGLGRTTKSMNKLFELVIKFAIDPEADEKKYLVTYNHEQEILLAMKDYIYRVDNVALFRIAKRPNRAVGRSIPQKTRDMNDEIDTMHRQRVNSRSITHVPSFIGNADKKKEFDTANPDARFKPGKTWWVPGGAAAQVFDQMKNQPADMGDSMNEENNDMRILDLSLGAAVALLSGQTAPGDPSAPGNKTNAMIGQSNLRMDDPLSEFRFGVNTLGDICLSHLYQFGPAVLDYMSRTDGGETPNTMFKKILRQGLKMKMAGITITQNPDTEMARGFQMFMQLMAWPVFQQNVPGQIEMVRDTLKRGRIQRWQKYVPTVEEMEQQQAKVQAMAMMEAQKVQEAQAMQQQQEQALKIKDLAAKTVESGIGSGIGANGNGATNGATQ